MLFADMEVPDGGTVGAGRLLQPRVEGEVAFVLGRDITVSDPTIADVIRAVDFLLPAIEIVDSRIAGWDLQIVATIAENAPDRNNVVSGKSVSGRVDLGGSRTLTQKKHKKQKS